MSIYRLYEQNGNNAGFWVQHRSWSNACARVMSIGGRAMGPLPGRAPLHDAATVIIQGFDIRSGRRAELGPALDDPSDHGFSRIAEPSWSRPRAAHAS